MSLPPERLDPAAGREWGVELKFSRRHEALARGERDLGAVLAAAGVSADRIVSVHLPPGLHQQGATGMTVTRATLSTVLDFVHDQLDAVPDAHLVAHPPERFASPDQLDLLGALLSSVDRPLPLETTPGESYWHTPEYVAPFGYLADREASLSGLYSVADSAHLPPATAGPGAVALDEDALATLADRLRADGLSLPDGFRDAVADRVAATADHRADLAVTPAAEPYFPLLRTLSLAGERVRAVHLNDPVADGAPSLTPHGDHAVVRAAPSILVGRGGTVVLEDGTLLAAPNALDERVGVVADLLASL